MKVIRIFAVLGVAFILATIVIWRQGESAAQDTGFTKLTLTMTTSKAKYVELEPIPIVLTLKNETSEPLMGHTVLEFTSGYVQLYVAREHGPQQIKLSLGKKLTKPQPRELKPGEIAEVMDTLNLKLDEVFPKPGTYQLQARLLSSDGKETISSKSVELEIAQPEGMDAQALEYIRADEPGYFFTGSGVMWKPEKLQRLENFVAMFGETAYGNDAALLLGQVHTAKREYDKARKLFEKLSKKSDVAIAKKASEYLKRIDREEKKDHP
jgi:hypothetical protein